MPEVSVIIPTYNVEAFIVQTINSVCEQVFSDWEILVVDDCSTDTTVELLKNTFGAHPKIRLFFNEENLGSGHCRNVGIEHANGRFIAFLDSDDVWLETKLSEQINWMKSQCAPISHTAYTFIDTNGNKIPGRNRASASVSLLDNLKRTEVGTSTAIIDTSIVGRGFRFSDIRARQDLVLWVDLMSAGHISYGLNSALVKYRVRGGSVSSNKLKMLWVTFWVYMRFDKLPIHVKCYCYFSYVINAIRKRF